MEMELLTRKEKAKELNVSYKWLGELVKRGKVKYIKLTGRKGIRFLPEK